MSCHTEFIYANELTRFNLCSFIHSSIESPDSSSSSSSIVFQSLSEVASAKVPPRDTQPVKALVPAQEKGQVVCPKTMRRIPTNYVPCVFLGQRDPAKGSKCPATGLDSSALLEEESSRSSIELNNNFCIDGEYPQWGDIHTTKLSTEVGDSRGKLFDFILPEFGKRMLQ